MDGVKSLEKRLNLGRVGFLAFEMGVYQNQQL
jgi:hypothetical protein